MHIKSKRLPSSEGIRHVVPNGFGHWTGGVLLGPGDAHLALLALARTKLASPHLTSPPRLTASPRDFFASLKRKARRPRSAPVATGSAGPHRGCASGRCSPPASAPVCRLRERPENKQVVQRATTVGEECARFLPETQRSLILTKSGFERTSAGLAQAGPHSSWRGASGGRVRRPATGAR